jgi:hypothetical protein
LNEIDNGLEKASVPFGDDWMILARSKLYPVAIIMPWREGCAGYKARTTRKAFVIPSALLFIRWSRMQFGHLNPRKCTVRIEDCRCGVDEGGT